LNPQAVAIPDLLRELLLAVGPSGHEEPAARVWRDAASSFAAVHGDSLGTSYARVSAGEGAATLAVIGHIDEIGFQVTHIGEDGLLSFTTLGGFSAEMLVGQRVLIVWRTGIVSAVVGRRESHEGRRGDRPKLEHSDLHVDLGAASRDEAAELVRPGDAGVWHADPLELAHGRIVSRALDNRLGAYVAFESARRVAEAADATLDLVAVAAVQEEIGFHGARTAAFALDPRVALAIDVTWATDAPGGNPKRAGKVELGSGATITRGPVINPRVSDLLTEAAEAEGIPHCFEVFSGNTQTDADAVHVARGGIPTGVISIPIRYMHSPCELASLDDLEAVIRLVVAFARRLTPETSFVR
jgi:putative aminopeptidase FrvX